MVIIDFAPSFKKLFDKVRNTAVKEQIRKQIQKIASLPESGKPMRFGRKGTRELYVKPYRLVYIYSMEEERVLFLDLYHKDEQ